eukprot:TRINITY_DN38584_c0_g2_i1.p1 TRINITY_DN38584_c0_g2~~TRINITY_DN38584_c0_g2_i1.p1  ORF type:complete len:137 (-),score=21.31 TRINITY_DN38584_c0_g2_i1:250-660(-)
MRLDVQQFFKGETVDGAAEQCVEVEEDLFRVGASSDVMALMQKHEDEYLRSRQVGEPLTEDVQHFAAFALYKLIFCLPGCFSEQLHVFNLSLSILSDIGAKLVSLDPPPRKRRLASRRCPSNMHGRCKIVLEAGIL